MRILTLLPLMTAMASVYAAEFSSPWKDPQAALVIDPYYANAINWDKLATESRVVAIIHKSTIGASKLDPSYFKRKEEARKRGYLWGSYHWGVAGNPEKQADFYLDTVKPAADELIALDLEDARSKTLMNVDEAIRFVERVKTRTGRYPVLYTNHASAKLISAKYKDSVFKNTPLWYARFKAKADQKALVDRQLADVRAFEAGNPAFLPEGDFDAAAAGLTQRLKQIVSSHASDPQRCQIIMNQYSRPTEKELFERVAIRVRLRCSLEEFAPVLHDLESGSPMLFVDEVQVWKQTGYRAPGSNQVASYLDVQFTLSGYLRKPGGGDKKPGQGAQ